MMDGWDGWGWGGWILMAAPMVLFWVAVITAIILGIRYVSAGGSHRNYTAERPAPTAEDVLTERFARGEIDEDEFRPAYDSCFANTASHDGHPAVAADPTHHRPASH